MEEKPKSKRGRKPKNTQVVQTDIFPVDEKLSNPPEQIEIDKQPDFVESKQSVQESNNQKNVIVQNENIFDWIGKLIFRFFKDL